LKRKPEEGSAQIGRGRARKKKEKKKKITNKNAVSISRANRAAVEAPSG